MVEGRDGRGMRREREERKEGRGERNEEKKEEKGRERRGRKGEKGRWMENFFFLFRVEWVVNLCFSSSLLFCFYSPIISQAIINLIPISCHVMNRKMKALAKEDRLKRTMW